MKDSDARGVVLKRLYEQRHSRGLLRVDEHLRDLQEAFPGIILFNIIKQLAEKGLVEHIAAHGHRIRITATGVDVMEGTREPPISINIDQSVAVHGSTNVQIGVGNIQNVSDFGNAQCRNRRSESDLR
jgi:hypothetical protein